MEKLTLQLENLSCPVCAEKVGLLLKKMKGVGSAEVFFATGKAKVTYEESEVSPGEIIKAVEKLGYKASIR
jgi:copper chaperone CopZ